MRVAPSGHLVDFAREDVDVGIRYGLIPRSVYIDDQGERIPVLFNPGQSDSRIILAVWTWEDVTSQVNGEPVNMRVYYDKVPGGTRAEAG